MVACLIRFYTWRSRQPALCRYVRTIKPCITCASFIQNRKISIVSSLPVWKDHYLFITRTYFRACRTKNIYIGIPTRVFYYSWRYCSSISCYVFYPKTFCSLIFFKSFLSFRAKNDDQIIEKQSKRIQFSNDWNS